MSIEKIVHDERHHIKAQWIARAEIYYKNFLN